MFFCQQNNKAKAAAFTTAYLLWILIFYSIICKILLDFSMND